MATAAARLQTGRKPGLGSIYHYDPLRSHQNFATVKVVQIDERSDGWYVRLEMETKAGLDELTESVLRMFLGGWIHQSEWEKMIGEFHLIRIRSCV